MTVNGNLYVPLAGWGRNINHDPRSKAYKAARFGAVVPVDVGWDIHMPPMDQGQLGSCVPHAGTAMLATDPFWGTLDAELKKTLSDAASAEAFAKQAYRDVTRLDPYPGEWEPTDTGSDGLSLWKLWQQRGYVNGSEHVMSLDDAHAAIQKGPFPIGISWLDDMDRPGTDGVVSVTGASRGGHEVLVYRYDKVRDLWWVRNSWGRGFGLNGDFAFDSAGYQKLMTLQADGTPMTPWDRTPPQPSPQPGDALADFPFPTLDQWAGRARHWWPTYGKTAAAAYLAWKARHGR